MARIKMAIVHKLSGEVVAAGPATASVGGMELEGIAISGEDEAVLVTEVDDDDVLDLFRTHVVVGDELRRKE
jgi:predicted regulator of Ras-like GTPase activity (Roadblock/LC7/MglB family)